MREKRKGGLIKHWRLNDFDRRVAGIIYGDSKFKEGEFISTSSIQKITIETRNTIYELDPGSQERERRPV